MNSSMLDKIKQELESASYSYVPNLLDSSELEKMNAFFDQHKQEFGPAKVGKEAKARVETIRGDHTYWLDPLNSIGPFQEVTQFLEKLRGDLNQHFFLNLKQYEFHLAFYPAGAFYRKHLDRFEKDSSRTLSFIFYLNSSEGGELVLYNKTGEILKTISPKAGSFVCFLSEDFPHEVREAKSERRSLTGWMHNKIIY